MFPFSDKKKIQSMTPRQIVAELDKFIIGQTRAKRIVAIALRNRERRRLLEPGLAEEVTPKNILMIGPTGVGKTEIARRLAKLAGAPFVKIEATKYTEVGYVGRDVDSMVRDLAETAVRMVRAERTAEVIEEAKAQAEIRLADLLLPPHPRVDARRVTRQGKPAVEYDMPPLREGASEEDDAARQWLRSRRIIEEQLREGRFEDREVEIEFSRKPTVSVGGMFMGPGGGGDMGADFQNLFEQMIPPKQVRTKLPVSKARKILIEQEVDQLLDMEKIVADALERAQQQGIIFIDEFDKIAGRSAEGHGPDVSREGVQRDILPIVEGSSVHTKYGPVQTNHVLFIAAGAFHMTKPSDLIPELQGRFPLRVELVALTAEDFRRILVEPDNALVKQYKALLATEGIDLDFTEDGIDEIARSADQVNRMTENIGARRLHTILERILEDVSFEAADMGQGRVPINRGFVQHALAELLQNQDLSRYIL